MYQIFVTISNLFIFSESFKLDSITGQLTISEPLDRETILSHILTIQVQDNGNPSLKDFAR